MYVRYYIVQSIYRPVDIVFALIQAFFKGQRNGMVLKKLKKGSQGGIVVRG